MPPSSPGFLNPSPIDLMTPPSPGSPDPPSIEVRLP